MIPLQNIWQSILDWENLLLAYRKAHRGKRNQAEIQQFGFDLEYELTSIRQALLQKTYQPGGFRQFQVCDRKIRLISAAPFRDRVVQHALMNQVEPVLDRESGRWLGHCCSERILCWWHLWPLRVSLSRSGSCCCSCPRYGSPVVRMD